ncbi:MAG TPA: energy transducer TonB [Candidatus Acidoferrales bacterium]
MIGRLLLVASVVAAAMPFTAHSTQNSPTKFQAALTHAREISTLAVPGAAPFHLQMVTTDSTMHNPEYAAQIEIWWAAPDRWRREVKSPDFTQTAVRSGDAYFESNSSDYLPYWLHELMRAAVDPVPVAELYGAPADEDRPGCGNWETEYGAGEEKLSSYNSVCFNGDGTANQIFATPIGVQLGRYEAFGGKKVARKITVWPGNRSDVTATVTLLEPLAADVPASSSDAVGRFSMPHDTNFAARLRFAQVPESALTRADGAAAPSAAWPSTFTFPLSGVVVVTVKIDRDGNVRELANAISKNQRINSIAIEQVKAWKFKPYVVDGQPVEVVTTLSVPFHLKYEPLGANGKSFPEISFRRHIVQSRALSDPRTEGGEPFTLRATFTFPDGPTGNYVETWAPATWKREAQVGSAGVTETMEDEKVNRMRTEANAVPPGVDLDLVLLAMKDHFPELHTFQEADWGNSAVPLSNIDPTESTTGGEPELIRAGRGGVAPNNQPINGQDYWFDAAGLLRADFVDPNTTVYSDFQTWNEKQIPRTIEVFRGGKLLVTIRVTSIDTK